jgi:hypothetical protein
MPSRICKIRLLFSKETILTFQNSILIFLNYDFDFIHKLKLAQLLH